MSSIRIDLANNGRWRVEILNDDKEVIAFCWANELFDALNFVKIQYDEFEIDDEEVMD